MNAIGYNYYLSRHPDLSRTLQQIPLPEENNTLTPTPSITSLNLNLIDTLISSDKNLISILKNKNSRLTDFNSLQFYTDGSVKNIGTSVAWVAVRSRYSTLPHQIPRSVVVLCINLPLHMPNFLQSHKLQRQKICRDIFQARTIDAWLHSSTINKAYHAPNISRFKIDWAATRDWIKYNTDSSPTITSKHNEWV
ncbi:hypothetical protein RclHR1_01660013 [Rhizophagus clarus]|uniref:Uncharacterized protein n=1 Tax=Rhizophagus clarus TaxID=94130 RepID=A0A2Z6QX09_9GLOM|nr:hypothetical protein RclHR1_01660013 [Rhizophagus clarus]